MKHCKILKYKSPLQVITGYYNLDVWKINSKDLVKYICMFVWMYVWFN